MDKRHDTVLETLMEQLIEGGAENMGLVFARVFDLAMQIERELGHSAPSFERGEYIRRLPSPPSRPERGNSRNMPLAWLRR